MIDSTHGTSATLQLLVEELQPLDIIQLWPRANFVGWVNYLRKAEIELQCAEDLALQESVPWSQPHYDRLDPGGDTIRLLTLLPGRHGEPICANLTSVDLLDASCPQFEALSYCWGQPFGNQRHDKSSDSTIITCLDDDHGIHQVQVSPNLGSALLHLRNSIHPRTLWVDQLCINQADEAERAQQVGMMSHIYSGAESVIVWLGAGDADTECSVDTVNKLMPHYVMPTKEALSDGSLKVGLPGVSNDDLPIKEVNRVLALPWFSRVWVVQEVWLARRSIFMYGRRTLSWETIWKANVWSKYGSFEVPGTQHTNLALIWTSFAEICCSKDGHTTMAKTSLPSRQDKLLTLVIQGLDLRASDPRDHIYGLYGLVEIALSSQDQWNQLIYPDYQKSASELFMDFTIWVILGTKSLRILSAIQAIRGRTWQTIDCTGPKKPQAHDQAPSHHPSWAMWYSGMRKWENKSLGGSRRYQVTGGSETNVSSIVWEGSERGKLPLQGYRLGHIRSIGPYQLHRECLGTDIFSVFNNVFDASGAGRIYSTPVTEAFKGYTEGWDNPLQHWVAHGHPHGGRLIVPAALPCLDHCVLQMDDGSKGLCPASTKPGDIVVILYGGDVPYLLRERQVEGQYSFIGECYLDGKMDGNLLTPLEEVGIPREDFILV